ncbi:MAG: RDD family protein [bacterium]|nr:RDD family protein [bacterium]
MARPDTVKAALPPLDNIFSYETPEGVELRLEPAGPMVRGLAWLTDLSIRSLAYLFLAVTLLWWGGVGKGLFLLALFCIEWLYPVFFEALTGATPGKRFLGLEVVRENGAPLDWTGAFLRNLLRAADFLPLFNALGLLTMLVHPKLQRLGDIAAGTLVVYRQEGLAQERIPEHPPAPSPRPLAPAEQRLILDYCARSAQLPPQRAAELAALVPALTRSKRPEQTLWALGNQLLRGGKPGASIPL